MRYLNLFFTLTFIASTFGAINTTVPYKRQDSDHIKEIFNAWNSDKGDYLYNSMAALVMHEQQPERPRSVKKTPYELLQSMSKDRIQRLDRIASEQLENERLAKRTAQQYYWEEWLRLLRSTECNTNRGDSNGDPHIRTYDGESYDFQNAGDYLLTASEDQTFMIQTQQVRMNKNISLNGAVVTNINGDEVELKPIDENNGQIIFVINGEELPESKADILLPQGGVINYTNNKYRVKWPTGEQMSVGVRKFKGKQLYDLAVYVPSCRQDYYGLLGNNDGVRNDIISRDPSSGEVVTRENFNFSFEDNFGENRRNPEVVDNRSRDAHFISRVYGRNFQLDSLNSLFTNQMTNIPDEVRYPEEYLSLAELDDEQIKIGLEKARNAGVAEDDLYGAIYDYGHLGLEPIAYNDDVQKPDRKVTPEPKINDNKTPKTTDNNRNVEIEPIRVRPTIFIGTSRSRVPVYRTPTPPVRTTPTQRRPSTGTSPSNGNRGSGGRGVSPTGRR